MAHELLVVVLNIEVVCVDGKQSLYKGIKLPFVPFAGLELIGSVFNEEEWEIVRVAWDCEQKCFQCYFNREVWTNEGSDSMLLAAATERWTRQGWLVSGEPDRCYRSTSDDGVEVKFDFMDEWEAAS